MSERRVRTIQGGLIFAALALLAIVVAPAPATANPNYDNLVPTGEYGNSECNEGINLCQADSVWHTYWLEPTGWNYGVKDAINNRLASFDGLTVIEFVEVSTPTYSGAWETDVIFEHGPLPGAASARVVCDDDSPGGWVCDQFYATFELSSFQGHPPFIKQQAACHEIGHTLGLAHGSDSEWATGAPGSDTGIINSCMVTPAGHPNSRIFFGNHNKWIIDNVYGP